MEYLKEIIDKFFITDDRWRYFTDGLLITLQVTAGALLLGLVIGIVVSIRENPPPASPGASFAKGAFILLLDPGGSR